MATVTKGKIFISGETVEPADLHQLVDSATVTEIVNADIKSDAAIAGTKIAPDFGSQKITTTGDLVVGKSTANARINVAATDNVTTNYPLRVDNFANNYGCGYGAYGMSNRIVVDTVDYTFDIGQNAVFKTANAERLKIDQNGAILVAGAAPSAAEAHINVAIPSSTKGAWTSTTGTTGGRLHMRFENPNGVVGSISTSGSATSFNVSSDYRLKENATPLIGGLATIEQLQPCEFTWKYDGSIGRGFIAHELQAVVPEAVTGEKDEVDAAGRAQYQGVDASKLVPYLVAAVKELSAKVAALEAA